MRMLLVDDSDGLNQVLRDLLAKNGLDLPAQQRAMSAGIILFDAGQTGPAEANPLSQLLNKIEQSTGEDVVARDKVTVSDITVDLGSRSVWLGRDRVGLPPKQYDLLAVLARNAGQVVSRRSILEAVWGSSRQNSSLNVHMMELRAKLGRPHLIQTVRGLGYRFGEPSEIMRQEQASSTYR